MSYRTTHDCYSPGFSQTIIYFSLTHLLPLSTPHHTTPHHTTDLMNKRVVFLVIIMLIAIPYLTNTQQDRSFQLSIGDPPPGIHIVLSPLMASTLYYCLIYTLYVLVLCNQSSCMYSINYFPCITPRTTDMLQSLAVLNDTHASSSYLYKNTLLAAIDGIASDTPVVSIAINGQSMLWNHDVIRCR